MSKLLPLLLALGLLSACAREEWRAPLALPNDSLAKPGFIMGKKVTFTGPVTFTTQAGTGNSANSAATDNTKAGQRGGAAATAPGAVATATTKKAGTPWWVYAGCVAAGAGLMLWLRRQLPTVGAWLARRAAA